jgi:hypothetical protein
MRPSIHESARRENRVLRALSLLVYAGIAALGEALAARPALLFLRGLGIFSVVLPCRVPFGAVQFILAQGIAVCAVWLASRAALGRPPRLALHAALLALLALAAGVRSQAAATLPPADPLPALLTGLRAAAGAVERGLDPAAIDAELATLDPPGFVRFGRRLPMRAKIIAVTDNREAPILDEFHAGLFALDLPGTICVSQGLGRRHAWLTARTLNGFAALPGGKPAVIEVRGGTRSEPGRDPLLPAYPGMRSLSSR